MGIQGLLPQLKSIMVPVHVKDLAGQNVAVDTYSWLHKGALSCSRELCKGLPTSRHIAYCMYRVNLLRQFGIKPILVFDGGFLPMKVDQETKRSRMRKENLERALVHESAGNSSAAYECYQKAVDISPSVAYELIQVLKEENVDYIVAPYEADAQMTFLASHKLVDAVITEDSDLIPFGCSRIIYKMDKFGQGVEFCYSLIDQNKDLNFTDFNKQMFLEMCILSGCDYLQSLPGMGLRRAHALIQKFKSFDKVIKHLRYSGVSVPPLFEESFKRAILTFRHQRVYDPKSEDIVHLSDIPHNVDQDLDFLGPMLPQAVVKGIARGDIDPFTKLPFEGNITHDGCARNNTYALKHFKPIHEGRRLNLPAQKNVLTKYFCIASLEAKRKYKSPQVNFKQLEMMEESLPSKEECVHLDNRASESLPSKEKCVKLDNRTSSSCLQVINKSADKSSPIVELACQGNLATSNQLLLQPKCETSRPFLISHKKHAIDSLGVLEGKTRTIMQQEDADKNSLHNTTPLCVRTGNNCSRMSAKRRKVITTRSENVAKPLEQDTKTKPFDYMESSFSSQDGSKVSTLVHKTVEENEEQKFQCDISHLSHYSSVAEKSMKRFVSVISSFTYVSSGSRASGLRAPLKDVQNVNRVRALVCVNTYYASKDPGIHRQFYLSWGLHKTLLLMEFWRLSESAATSAEEDAQIQQLPSDKSF